MPPRLFRLSKYALLSFPVASTSWEGFAPGTSMSIALTPPKVRVAVIEIEPICRRPVVCGLTAPEWAGLQTNDRFATPPDTSSAERVTGDDKHVGAVAGNAAMSPDTALSAVVAQAITPVEGLFICTPTTQP